MPAPEHFESLLDEAESALAEGRPEDAERLARDALKAQPDHPDALFLLADALRDQGRLDEAEGLYRAIVLARPSDADAWASLAGVQMFQLRWAEANKSANRALQEDPACPEAAYVRAVIREQRGDFRGAKRDFLRAWSSDPAGWPLPVELDDASVEEVVASALSELHPTLREYLADIPILLEEFPSDEVLRYYDPPAYPTELLGYFSGQSLLERSSDDPWSKVPGTIVIFRRNLQRFARDREMLLEELRITLFHEVGHFLGLGEEDLEERGLD